MQEFSEPLYAGAHSVSKDRPCGAFTYPWENVFLPDMTSQQWALSKWSHTAESRNNNKLFPHTVSLKPHHNLRGWFYYSHEAAYVGASPVSPCPSLPAGGWILNCQHQHFFARGFSPVPEACLLACLQVISTWELKLPSTSGQKSVVRQCSSTSPFSERTLQYLLHLLPHPPAGFCSNSPQWHLLDKLFIADFFLSLFHDTTPLPVFPEITPYVNYSYLNPLLRFCCCWENQNWDIPSYKKWKTNVKSPESPRAYKRYPMSQLINDKVKLGFKFNQHIEHPLCAWDYPICWSDKMKNYPLSWTRDKNKLPRPVLKVSAFNHSILWFLWG